MCNKLSLTMEPEKKPFRFAYYSVCGICGTNISPKEKCFDLMVMSQKWDDEIITEDFVVAGDITIPVSHERGFVDDKVGSPYIRICERCHNENQSLIKSSVSDMRKKIKARYCDTFSFSNVRMLRWIGKLKNRVMPS